LRIRYLLETTIALLVFAAAYALIRIALSEIPPLTLGAIRFILASGIMLPLVLVRYRGNASKIVRSDLLVFTGLAIVQIVIPNALQNIGLEYTTASVSSVLQSTTPVFTLLFSFALLRESVRPKDLVGVILGMTGVALLSTGGDFSSLGSLVFVGNLLQLGVAASYAASGIVGKVLLKRFDPVFVVTVSFVIGALVLSGFAAWQEINKWPSSLSAEVVVAVLLLSGLYCVALVSWYDVLQHTSVFRLYVLLFTMPVLAVLISVLVLGETFTIMDILFSALTLSGVAVTEFRNRK
jgi:drug/metabolite transporter (DMT)-like permease